MNGTRRARLIALTATLACGLTLSVAALLATAQHDGAASGGTDVVTRTPPRILTGSPVTSLSVVTPHTTPPPTYPGSGTGAVRPLAPSAAETVEHS